MLYKEITIFNSISHILDSWKKSIEIIKNGQINVDILISDVFELKNWKEAFRKAEAGWGVKVLFRISEEHKKNEEK
jgi:threonine dehydrogenase-like Zn-dependent dehydrogenase